MKNKNYLLLLLILSSGCAINYKSGTGDLICELKQDSSIENSINIKKFDDTVFFSKNEKIKKQFLKKGFKSFLITLKNNTADTLFISKESLFAINNYEPISVLPKEKVIGLLNLNRGLFISASGYGLVSSFGYAGRKLIFSKKGLLFSISFLVYGISNTILINQSVKNLKKDLENYYILEKKVLPGGIVSGFILVNSINDDVKFEYKLSGKFK